MDRRPLDNNIALPHRSLDPVVQNQLDLAFENNSKIDALRPVHDVDFVLRVPRGRKIHDATEHARRVNKADLLAMDVGEGALGLRRHAVRFEDVRKARYYAFRWLAFGVEGVGRHELLVGVEDGFPVCVVAWMVDQQCHNTCWGRKRVFGRPVTMRRIVGRDIAK